MKPPNPRIPVENPEALAIVLDLIDNQATGVRRVLNVTIDDQDVVRGNAVIPMGSKDQYLVFKIDVNRGRISYRGVDGPRVDAWREDVNSKSKRFGRKLNCKNGNIQCGGKCQNPNNNCWVGMTPQDKAAAQKAARLARKAKLAATPRIGETTPPQKQKAKQAVGQAKSGGGGTKATTNLGESPGVRQATVSQNRPKPEHLKSGELYKVYKPELTKAAQDIEKHPAFKKVQEVIDKIEKANLSEHGTKLFLTPIDIFDLGRSHISSWHGKKYQDFTNLVGKHGRQRPRVVSVVTDKDVEIFDKSVAKIAKDLELPKDSSKWDIARTYADKAS